MAICTWLVTTLALLCTFSKSQAADPDPLQDFCVADMSPNAPIVNGYPCKPINTVTARDFTFTGFREPTTPPSESDTGATLTFGDASQWPGLNMQGVAHVRLDMDIGGVVPLHTHPRATETLFLLKGRIFTGFISSANKAYTMTLQAGDMTVFPQAMTHFQVNVGNETAVAFNSYNAQNPGFLVTVNQMFDSNISSAVIQRSFGIDSATEMTLRNSRPHYWDSVYVAGIPVVTCD